MAFTRGSSDLYLSVSRKVLFHYHEVKKMEPEENQNKSDFRMPEALSKLS